MSYRACAIAVSALLLAGTVAGCKSDGAAGLLDPQSIAPGDKAAAADAPADKASAAGGTVGSGSVRIAVLLPSDTSGPLADQARDVRDGVTMAVDDLASDVLKVSFENLPSGKPKEAALSAMGEGAAAVIGPAEPNAAAQLTTIKGATLTPVFLLADGVPGSTSIYSVPLQSGTSAAAGARAVGKDGALNFLLLTQEGHGASAAERAVDLAVADHGGRIAAKARFGSDQASMIKAVDTVFAVMDAPDAVVVAGGAFDPATVVKAIRGKNAKTRIVGNSSWISSGRIGPELDGVLIADVDQAELAPVADRFRARFGHDFDALAAYSYDIIALSTGIARATGREGFVRSIIEDRKGFRGSTGTFRFRSDGSSERLLALYKVQGGKLKKVQSPPALF